MSEFKDKIIKEVEIIDKTISNDEERKIVMKSIESLIQDFTTHLVQVVEFQNNMQDQIADIQDSLIEIHNQINEDIDFEELKCPYCGDLVPSWLIEDSSNEIECPNCHKTIVIDFDDDSNEL